MSDLTLSSDRMVHGLRAIQFENRFLSIVVLPEAGAKIWQIVYKPLNTPLLWNNPNAAPARHAIHASYDDVWSGGWDELFPNDEAGQLNGHDVPDHGELWTGDWQAGPFIDEGEAGVQLKFVTPISHFLVERTIVLGADSSMFEIRYSFTNRGTERFPFLWKLHPAFAVSADYRVDFPAMTVVREPEFAGSLGDAPLSFPWPHAPVNGAGMDLRQIPDVSSRAVHFFYGTGMSAGWCGMTNRRTKLAAALRFDPAVFTSCWLFASYGGWRDLNVTVLEPATGYPYRIHSMIENGSARWLAPGESLATTVQFSTQEGLSSVGGVDESGQILPGGES